MERIRTFPLCHNMGWDITPDITLNQAKHEPLLWERALPAMKRALEPDSTSRVYAQRISP